jgi:hypothetical protein
VVKPENSILLWFDLSLSPQNLGKLTYSNHQQSLYNTITNLREEEMNNIQIRDWLNKNGYNL